MASTPLSGRTAVHPDRVIAAEVAAEARESERADIAACYQPRRWRCGYVGDGGEVSDV